MPMSSTYSQLPGQLGLSLRRGDELGTTIDFSPTTMTGYTVSAVITSLVTGSTVAAFQTTLTNAAAGIVNIALTEQQTAALPVGTYGWRLEWDAPGSVRRTALQGLVEVVG
jgi:hypothetical protein